jgi:hypothetical protein
MSDVRFASIVVAEQWLLAQAELMRGAAPVAAMLAEKAVRGDRGIYSRPAVFRERRWLSYVPGWLGLVR